MRVNWGQNESELGGLSHGLTSSIYISSFISVLLFHDNKVFVSHEYKCT